MTPIGPLSFSFANALSKASTDKTETFRFNLRNSILMKFFFFKIFFFFFLIGISNANENIRFININYIVKNSEAGKALNKIIENKNKKIKSELNDLGKKIEKQKK